MLIINKTKNRIGWRLRRHGGRCALLEPGTNDIREDELSKNELALIRALIKDGIVEEVEPPPDSGARALDDIAPAAPAPQLKKRRAKKT